MASKHRAMVHQDERVPELKKYPCEQCDKVFNSSNRLKLHIEGKHLNIKRFGCEACGYRTNDRCRLKDHINIMHEKKPMNCKFCDFMCYSKTIYGKHMRKFHKPPKKIIKVDAYQWTLIRPKQLLFSFPESLIINNKELDSNFVNLKKFVSVTSLNSVLMEL